MNNISLFDTKSIEKLGRTLVKIASRSPNWLVKKTPYMRWVFQLLRLIGNASGKIYNQNKTNNLVASRLDFKDTQYNLVGLNWLQYGSFRFPILHATYEQQSEYFKERRPVQMYSKMVFQIDQIFRAQSFPQTVLPSRNLLWWLRHSLQNSPVHWYLNITPGKSDNGSIIEIDFSSICDEVDHESADCKYNVRDLKLTDDNTLMINSLSNLRSVKRLTSSDSDSNRSVLEHSSFLALTLLQQANEATYHNWIHFYYNDLVLLNFQNNFPKGHWLRQMMDPHMRYQNVVNNAGLYSRVSNDFRSNEVYDDILFSGNLISWSLDTFQKNIMDRTLGYYQKANHAKVCADTNRLNFNLNHLASASVDGGMGKLVVELDALVVAFVGEVINRCAKDEDDYLMGLVVDNTLKYLHADCLAGIEPKNNNVRGIFKLIASRYLLQAGLLHGIEHFSAYFWFAPLCLPQRIRKMLDTQLTWAEYSYPIDKQNGTFGHEIFTRYTPNEDQSWNWSSLKYNFQDNELNLISNEFVKSVQNAIINYDESVLKPAREILTKHGIPYTDGCVLTPSSIGCSICF